MPSVFNSSLRIRKAPATAATHTRADGTPAPDKPASNGDNALSRLAKLAPSEVMTVYLAGKSVKLFQPHLEWFALSMLVICFFWRWAATHEDGKPTQWLAIVSATISFGLWAAATDGEKIFGPGSQEVAGFLAILWTVLGAPILNKGD